MGIDSDRMTWQSWLNHMRSNQDGLRNYANLVYAGLAKVPASKKYRDEFMGDIRPHVSRCLVCYQLVGEEPDSCGVLTEWVREQARVNLEANRDRGFYCMDYDQERRGRLAW